MSSIPSITIAISSISAFFSILVLLNYYFMKERPRLNDPSSMIVFLTLSDLAIAIVGCFLSRTGSGFIYCDIRVTILLYFSYASILWTAAMSHSCFTMVQNLLRSKRVKNLFYRYQIICWGVPLISSIINYYVFEFGHVGGVDRRVCWLIAPNSWAELAAIFGVMTPLGVALLYNISILKYFAKTWRNFPASRDLLQRLQRTHTTITGSKIFLYCSFIFSMYLSFWSQKERDDSSVSWIITVFIFIMPSIQGFVDTFVYFESRIVSRRPDVSTRSLNNVVNPINSNRLEYSSSKASRSNPSHHISNHSKHNIDYVFENFAVPVRSETGSDDLEDVFGDGRSVDLESVMNQDLNDIELDSMDGNNSEEDGYEGNYRKNKHQTKEIGNRLHGIDFDDEGIQFQTLGHDIQRIGSVKSPLKSASDPIDLITF